MYGKYVNYLEINQDFYLTLNECLIIPENKKLSIRLMEKKFLKEYTHHKWQKFCTTEKKV